MKKFTQKYSIVSFLGATQKGDTFTATAWPPHVTLIDVFGINTQSAMLAAPLQQIAQAMSPIQTFVTSYDYFGPQQNIRVALLQKQSNLLHLHKTIINLLKQFGGAYNEPQYINEGFNPHLTLAPQETMPIGTSLQITNIALIDIFPNKDPYQRTVLQYYPIS